MNEFNYSAVQTLQEEKHPMPYCQKYRDEIGKHQLCKELGNLGN